jgi:MSHA biogenesis protein MshJ
MNERLQEQLSTAIRTIESRKQSEKLLVMFMLLTGLVLGYLSVAYDPLSAQKVQISAQISNLQSQIQTQQASYATKEAASQEDPSRFANDRILAITAELQTLDSEITNLAGDLVSPNEMTQILTTVLSRYSGLELIRFDNTQATPLRSGLTNSANGAVQELCSHRKR